MYRIISVLLIAVVFTLMSSCSLSEETVATVGGVKITAEQFKQKLKKRHPNQTSFTSVDSTTKISMLNQMITEQLKANAAKDLNLDETEDYLSEMRAKEGRIIGNKYFEVKVVDELFPEDVLRELYEKQKDEVNVSHILIGYKGARGGKAVRPKDEALKLAEKLAREANAGADFEELALQNSDDPSAKHNKGSMGFFTWGRMVDSFQEKAFSMEPGEISDPVESPFGFHVIKFFERRPNVKYSPDDFEAKKFEIKRGLYPSKKDTAMVMWKRNMEKLKKDAGLTKLDDNITKVVELVKEKKNNGPITPDSFNAEEMDIVLAEMESENLTVKSMFSYFKGPSVRNLQRNLENAKMLNTLVDNLAGEMLVYADSKRLGIDKYPDIKAMLDDVSNQQLAAMAEKAEVKDKVVLSDEELKKYYDENTAEFKKPAEMEIWEIYVTKEDLAKKISRWAKAGKNFEKLASKYTEDKYYQKKNGYLGYRQERRRGAVSKEAFAIGKNKVSNPVKYKKGWAVVKTGTLKAESIRSFEEAKSQAASKLRSTKLRELKDKWDKDLRTAYNVDINYGLMVKI